MYYESSKKVKECRKKLMTDHELERNFYWDFLTITHVEELDSCVVQPNKAFILLFLIAFKPILVILIRCRCKNYVKQATRSYYAHKLFVDRCFYDFCFIIVPAFVINRAAELEGYIAVIISISVVVQELLVYFLAIKPANDVYDRVVFR